MFYVKTILVLGLKIFPTKQPVDLFSFIVLKNNIFLEMLKQELYGIVRFIVLLEHQEALGYLRSKKKKETGMKRRIIGKIHHGLNILVVFSVSWIHL